jgi:hypothetical protein
VLLLLIFGLASVACPHGARPVGAGALAVRAEPFSCFEEGDPSRSRFGALSFIGGLELSSDDGAFGGLSALRLEQGGERFVALSDRAYWLRGRIVARDGVPLGIAGAEMGPVLGPDGRPAERWDTESLALDGGDAWVGIERLDAVARFAFGRSGLLAPARLIDLPPGAAALPPNRGLEALVFVPRELPLGGSLIAISERALDGEGNIAAFIIGGPRPGMFHVRRSDGFDVSDAALLPGGDLLLLERRFTLTGGFAARIRRLPEPMLRPGSLADGPVLFAADGRHRIDNLEALDVHRSAHGLVLTMMSDDNYLPLQKTLLLQFELGGNPEAAGPRAAVTSF